MYNEQKENEKIFKTKLFDNIKRLIKTFPSIEI